MDECQSSNSWVCSGVHDVFAEPSITDSKIRPTVISGMARPTSVTGVHNLDEYGALLEYGVMIMLPHNVH